MGSDNLHLIVGPLTDGLVLRSKLSSELGAASSSLVPGHRCLLVEDVHGLLELLASSLRVLLDLGSVSSHMLVGPGNASVGGRGKGSHLQLVGSMSLVAGDTGTDELGTVDVRLVAP